MSSQSTKQFILHNAGNLFLKQGYEATTMQQIAKACGISLGNVNYYYRKKSDMLMDLHHYWVEGMLQEVMRYSDKASQFRLCTYLSIHIAYLHSVINSDEILRLYVDATKLPKARQDYIGQFRQLYVDLVYDASPDINKRNMSMNILILCAGEFETLSYYYSRKSELNFDELIQYPLRSFLLLCGFSGDDTDRIVTASFEGSLDFAPYFHASNQYLFHISEKEVTPLE